MIQSGKQMQNCRFYKVHHIYASYLNLPVGSHRVQGFFPSMKVPSIQETDGGLTHQNVPEPAGKPVQVTHCGGKPSSFRVPTTFLHLLPSLCLFFLVPLLRRWDKHSLTTFYVHFNSAGLGHLGDFATWPLQPAIYYVKWAMQMVYCWVKRWPVAPHKPLGF